MVNNHFTPRLELKCGAVTRLRVLYLLVLLSAICCIASLPLSSPWLFLLLTMTVVGAWRCWRQRCELGGAVITLLWDAEGRWWWRQAGEERELELCADSYLSAGMVILNFTRPESRRRHSLLLFPISVSPVLFRRLRVRLLLEGRPGLKPGSEN